MVLNCYVLVSLIRTNIVSVPLSLIVVLIKLLIFFFLNFVHVFEESCLTFSDPIFF